ncbi:MAG: beta/gamma crystallin-related protein, partial [Phenylobacterium sp.]
HTKTLALAALAALSFAAAAEAQPAGRGRPSATLYDQENFEGQSVTVSSAVGKLSDYRFNDRALSLKLTGLWRLCEHADFGGRCVELTGDVKALNPVGLAGRISSLAPAGGGGPRPGPGPIPGPGPGGGYGRGERGVEGANTVFFARPSVRGIDVAAGSNGANTFCRNQGLGGAVYYDSSERAPRAIGPDGEFVGRSSVLRDLLCQKY